MPQYGPQIAQACNEIFTGEHRYVQHSKDAEIGGRGPDFVTNPNIEFLSAQVRYVEKSPNGEIAHYGRLITAFGDAPPTAKQITDKYNQSVGRYHALGQHPEMQKLFAQTFPPEEKVSMIDWYTSRATGKRQSLLSMYILGRVAESDNILVDTIVYPEHIYHEFRLRARDAIVKSLPRYSQEEQRKIKVELLQDERLCQLMGDIAASRLLVGSEQHKNLILGPLEAAQSATLARPPAS